MLIADHTATGLRLATGEKIITVLGKLRAFIGSVSSNHIHTLSFATYNWIQTTRQSVQEKYVERRELLQNEYNECVHVVLIMFRTSWGEPALFIVAESDVTTMYRIRNYLGLFLGT